MLCKICLEAFASAGPYHQDGDFHERNWVPHHPSFSSLQASASLKCLICAKFWNQQEASVIAAQLESEASSLSVREGIDDIAAGNINHLPATNADTDTFRHGTRLGVLNLYAELDSDISGGPKYGNVHEICVDGYGPAGGPAIAGFKTYLDLFLQPKVASQISEGSSPSSTNLESSKTFSLATRWIEDCIEHHPSCGATTTWHPHRLLDSGPLGSTNNNQALVISLHERGSPESILEGPYMTLSYCWGSARPLLLTKQTYPTLITGIPLQDLPQAFQDAIRICRGVGIRYLWIDALCIFQDDLADWQREARQMHKVYSNSFCNISAATGESGLSPILRAGQTTIGKDAGLHPNEMEIKWQNKKDGNKITTSTCHVYDAFLWYNNVAMAPVNRRAWVLQERMLSPRLLHFAETQTFWECFEKQACETYPDGFLTLQVDMQGSTKALPSKNNDDGIRLFSNSSSSSSSSSEAALRKLHHQWSTLVQTYSRSRLTFPTDTLIAISAIARRFATYFQDDEYLAGMWRKSLETDLLWNTVTPDPKPRNDDLITTQYYIAPSWSWASSSNNTDLSIPGAAKLELEGWPHIEKYKRMACVDEVQIEYTASAAAAADDDDDDDDFFGPICGGRLRLRGVLQRVQLLPASSDFPDISGLSVEQVDMIIRKRFPKYDEYRVIINDIPATVGHEHTGNEEGDIERSSCSVYDVALDRDPYKRYDEENRNGMLFCMLLFEYEERAVPWNFLLLEVVNTAPVGTFRRLGVVRLSYGEAMDRAALSRHAEEASFPCVEYRDGQHSIWII